MYECWKLRGFFFELASRFTLEKAMASHSSTLDWQIPWTEEPGRLKSMGSLSRTWLSDFTFTFHFHALEKEMATHSSVFAWRIPGTGEPGGLPSMGSHSVGHDWSDLAEASAARFPHLYKCAFYYYKGKELGFLCRWNWQIFREHLLLTHEKK